MRVRLLRLAIVLSVTATLLSAAGFAVDVKTLAAAVDAHYNHLRSLQAEFTEVYRGSGWTRKPQDIIGSSILARAAARKPMGPEGIGAGSSARQAGHCPVSLRRRGEDVPRTKVPHTHQAPPAPEQAWYRL